MASIIIKTGKHIGYYYSLGRRTTVVGRAEALAIRLFVDNCLFLAIRTVHGNRNLDWDVINER